MTSSKNLSVTSKSNVSTKLVTYIKNNEKLPWDADPKKVFRVFRNPVTSHVYYDPFNLTFLYGAVEYYGYLSDYFLTFLQAKKLGLKFIDNQKGTGINILGKGSFIKDVIDQGTGEVRRKKLFGARLYTLFNLDQFVDNDLKNDLLSRWDKSARKKGVVKEPNYKKAKNIWDKLDDKPALIQGTRPKYDVNTKSIIINFDKNNPSTSYAHLFMCISY